MRQRSADPEDEFAQVLAAEDGSSRGAGPERRRRCSAAPRLATGRRRGRLTSTPAVAGVDGDARAARRGRPGRGAIVVAGQSLEDRDETLADCSRSFAIGGPIAVLLASLLGYLLASSGLRPWRRCAGARTEVSLEGGMNAAVACGERRGAPPGQTLNEMLARLRGSFERERRFVADASHELRTPWRCSSPRSRRALRTRRHGTPARAPAAALEECDHLAQLAEDLLVVARAGEGRLPVRPEDRRAAAARGRSQRFAVRAASGAGDRVEDAPTTRAVDPLRLRQALGNLVDNALRHGAGDSSCARGARTRRRADRER